MALNLNRKGNISNQLTNHIEKTLEISKNKARCLITLADIIPNLYIFGLPIVSFCFSDIKMNIERQDLFICVGLKKDTDMKDSAENMFCIYENYFSKRDMEIKTVENMIENIFGKKLDKTKKILEVNPKFQLHLIFTEQDPKQYIIDRSIVDIAIKFYSKCILYSKTNFNEKKFDMVYSKINSFKYTNQQAEKFLEMGFSFKVENEETNSDELKCKICTVNKVKKVFRCGHMICYKCFMNLEKTTCPYCRQSFIPWEIPLLHF